MFNNIISWSLGHKFAVLFGASLVVLFGTWSLWTMKIDILPDINKPTVTVFAEAPGMATEDVERLILIPLESALLGAPDTERVRGNASFAQATVNIEFAWGSDIYRNRQIVQERLSQAILPANITPILGPSTSLLGEIMWVGITTENPEITPMDLRTLADWTIRPALLKTPGVADVLVMGGDAREWQINLNAERMRREGVMIDDVRAKVAQALADKSGNYFVAGKKEYPIRIIVAPKEVEELGRIAIRGGMGGSMSGGGEVIRLADIATIEEGPSPIRGSGAIDGKPGVVLRVIRQPDAQTLDVTDAINATFRSLGASMPEGVLLHSDLFRQENFIRAGLTNVIDALRDGTILVIVILIIFLMNLRTTAITLTAIPLSILVTAIVFKQLGLSVNVMTLGGIAVAVGELVDDAIVDIENIFRRLRQWKSEGKKGDREEVVQKASMEVRNSIVYATVLVAVAFLPIFFVSGLEGRLLASLGAAYLVSLAASMIVSLTVTPVLAALFLHERSLVDHEHETKIVLGIKKRIAPGIRWCIGHVRWVGGAVLVAILLTAGSYAFAGKEGIPPFNEGSAVIMLFLPPGTALEATNDYVSRLEAALLQIPGVRQVSNIAGRAPSDPHGGSVNSSEIQIAFQEGAFEEDRARLFREIQMTLERFGGADYSLGQPITHRIEMLLSGVRAPIVVKVFGDENEQMDAAARQVLAELRTQPGIKNPRIQQNSVVPEFRVYVDSDRLAQAGISSADVASDLEMGLMGDTIGEVRLGSATVPVVARYDDESKGAASSLRDLALPYVNAASLGSAADVRIEGGRNAIDHEGGKRTLTVTANYEGRNIVGEVDAVKAALERQKLPVGVTLSHEGNYKSQKESTARLLLVGIVGILGVVAILYSAFRSAAVVAIMLANVPAAFLGGMLGVWLSGGTVSLAHLVGFISLAGIVSRNGIMLIGRTLTLVRDEGAPFVPETIVRATLDRVTPVLMTSLVTALALVPLLLAGDAPGKEMLHPLAVVMFGGLLVSTVVSLFLTPALFYRFGEKVTVRGNKESTSGF
ncbi:MAG TPA: efflux RND transporter permease subunit [Candidatus Paceibacterota bacterium]|nr:efflux RND transporter permease subunit [Candidatus Paceibacterota bacterium]